MGVPPRQMWPAAHGKHWADPGMLEYVPGGHKAHRESSLFRVVSAMSGIEKNPTLHCPGMMVPAGQYLLGGQTSGAALALKGQ